MFAKFVCYVLVGVCLGAGGCGPCGIGRLQVNPAEPPRLDEQLVNAANGNNIGKFLGYYSPSVLRVFLNRPAVAEPAGAATYTLELYDGQSSCPPAPGSPSSSLGSATDSAIASDEALFDFSGQAISQITDVSYFRGKILVLRAMHPELEPTSSVACTPALTIIAAQPESQQCISSS
jgi:hypothetical protein